MLIRLSVPPKTDEEKALLAPSKVNSIPDPVYGGQLQDFAIQGFEAEGKTKITYEEKPVTLAGGETVSLRAPTYEIVDLGYGPMQPGHHDLARASPRR